MDEPTRGEAITKLDAIVSDVGYPDRWRDFSSVEFAPDELVGNWRRVAAFEQADAVKALGEPRRDYTTPAMQRQNLLTDPHGLGEFRANGTVRNFGPWYAAFGVGEGDRMCLAPDERMRIC